MSDDSLVQCLVEIRRGLGDLQHVVKTVRGRGYMLDAAVSEIPPPMLPVAGSSVATRSWGLVVAGACAVAVAIVGVTGWTTAGARVTVTPDVTLNEEARRAYDQGLRALGGHSQIALQTARRAFESAVEHDPNYAPAYSALSNTLTVLYAFGTESPTQLLPAASRAARRAVTLDPTHAFGWHALAHSQVQWDRDWVAAEASYRRAQALDPSDFRPRYLLAHLLAGMGRLDEALLEEEHALAVAPQSPLVLASKGIVNYLARRPESALEAFDRSLAESPAFALPRFWQGLAYSSLGRYDKAMAAALASREAVGNAPTWVVGYVHARAGRRREALEVLSALEIRERTRYVPPVDLALLHLALGNHDAALDWLEKGLKDHSRWMELLAVLPAADPLRGSPRFQAILRALRLPILP